MNTRKGRGSRGRLISDSDDYALLMEKYINEKEAAAVLNLSVESVRAYKAGRTPRLPSEIAPNGQKMLLRAGVMAYGKTFYSDDQLPYATCADCGNSFERTKRTSGRAKDATQKFYRDGNLCVECRKAAKNGGVRENAATSAYEPHSGGQQLVHDSLARFKILNCGAGWGKDRCLINDFIRKFADMMSEDRRETQLEPRVHGFLIAPSYKLAEQIWRELIAYFPSEWTEQVWEGSKTLRTKPLDDKGGYGLVEVRSADDPNALVSVGLDVVLVTEASRIPDLERVWTYLLGRVNRPMRGPGGKGGLIMANSTPTGIQHFWYKLYRLGNAGDEKYNKRYESFHFTSYDNPYLDKEELDAERLMVSDRRFRQERLAEFIAEADSVFIGAEECATYTGPSEADAGETYLVSWDIGQKVDNAAVGVRNSRGETVEVFHWTGVPYAAQLDRVIGVSRKYNYATVRFDATGVGQTMGAQLDKAGVNCDPIHWTNSLKAEMVENLAFLMEQKAIAYPHHEAMIGEFKEFKYTISDTNVTRYSAPRGSHDDLVSMMVMLYKDYNQSEMEVPFFGIFGGAQIGNGKRSHLN
jgi:hypothetical protein